MIGPLTISDEAFSYLVHQRGALWELREDRAAWEAAYRRDLDATYHALAPYLRPAYPGTRMSILDIGSGLAGIDLLLWDHYQRDITLTLLDGPGRGPWPERHDIPFSDHGVAARFLEANGFPPGQIYLRSAVAEGNAQPLPVPTPLYDLVISVQAWCFHFPPERYLEWARRLVVPGGVLALDVRRGRPFWLSTLIAKLGTATTAAQGRKSDLMVFHVPKD
jgi:SAM-dependent methyltransferase